jgi:ribosomal protein L7Ae-like RNA K-turn-binding protein
MALLVRLLACGVVSGIRVVFEKRRDVLGSRVGCKTSEKVVVLRTAKFDTRYDGLARCGWRRSGHF